MVAPTDPIAVNFYNEWHDTEGHPRSHYAPLLSAIESLGHENLASRWVHAQRRVNLDAVTFYLDPGTYRSMPTDFLPRVIPLEHWKTIAFGVEQRLRAINHFLAHLYAGTQDVVPDEVLYTSQHFYPEFQDFRPPKDLFVHIYGIDLVHMGGG